MSPYSWRSSYIPNVWGIAMQFSQAWVLLSPKEEAEAVEAVLECHGLKSEAGKLFSKGQIINSLGLLGYRTCLGVSTVA